MLGVFGGAQVFGLVTILAGSLLSRPVEAPVAVGFEAGPEGGRAAVGMRW